MKTSLLDYTKVILTKVYFDSALREKEYKKAIVMLEEEEKRELEHWLMQQSMIRHSNITKPIRGE